MIDAQVFCIRFVPTPRLMLRVAKHNLLGSRDIAEAKSHRVNHEGYGATLMLPTLASWASSWIWSSFFSISPKDQKHSGSTLSSLASASS